MHGGKHIGRVLDDHADLCCCCIASHCNLTTFQHSDHTRPSFSDEIKRRQQSQHHLTDGESDDMYGDCTELTRDQFAALFSADLDAYDDDFGYFEPAE